MSDNQPTTVRHTYPTFTENVKGQTSALAATAVVLGGGLALLAIGGKVVEKVTSRKKPAPVEDTITE